LTAVRLVAIDLDGTLIGDSLTISDADRRAIGRAQSAGIEICIATGRMFSAGRPFAEALGLQGYLIPLNGAAVYDVATGAMVHAVPLDTRVAVEALDALRAKNYRVQLYFDDKLYLDGMDERAEHYIRMSRVEPVMVPDLRVLLTGVPPPEPGPMKLLGIGPESDVLIQVAELSARLGTRANVFRSQPPYIEVTDPKADKGSALEWVAGRCGIDLQAVAAIGDSDNDAPMFARAGCSFAVSSGTPLAKSTAKIVVGPLGTGVAEALAAVLEGAKCERA
jgi:Cof subfamily protein (haloacid dehalogenase superfamily)